MVIKTRANIGDSWIFYNNSGGVYYTASVIAQDTMTVLTVLDSVKTIMINAYNSSGPVISDPLDSFNIVLSKNNGFVQVFDLYTFPYHKPDSVYRPGLDFYLDRSTLTGYNVNGFFGNPPTKSITLFNLVDFINPNEQQLHNWSIGDVFEYRHEYGSIWPTLNSNFILDTVGSKIISGNTISYTVYGVEYLNNSPFPGHTRSVYNHTFVFSDLTYPIADTSLMPEESFNSGNYVFYFPRDSSGCIFGPAYTTIPCHYFPGGLGWVWEKTDSKLGVGVTHYTHQDGNPTTVNDDLIYYNIAGFPCGSLTIPPTSAYNISGADHKLQLFPNPATNLLTIKTTNTQPYSITLQNTLGQTLQTLYSNKQEQTLNVSDIPAGVYNISITDESGNRYNEKVVIMH